MYDLTEAGLLSDVSPSASAAASGPAPAATLPGLVNMHDHLRAFLPTGRHSEGAPLSQVITAAASTQAAATPEHYRALTALASARNLLAGATTVVDHVYPLHRPGLAEAVIAGHADVGIRGYLALGIMTRGDERICTSVADIVKIAAGLADEVLPAERLYLAPVSLRQNAAEDYADAARAADDLGVRLYTHIAETAEEVRDCVAAHGVRPVELLYQSGFLRPGTVLVHGIHLDDRDIELIARTETSVVYCPTNHLRFAKGFAPVPKLLEAGVRVTLGVDGMESLFHEMRHAIFAQGEAAGRPGVLDSESVFRMATSGAAQVLGMRANDVVRVDLSGPACQPLIDPLWTVVHRGSPAMVTDVSVDGRTVVQGGQLTLADSGELAQAATVATQELADLTGTNVSMRPRIEDLNEEKRKEQS